MASRKILASVAQCPQCCKYLDKDEGVAHAEPKASLKHLLWAEKAPNHRACSLDGRHSHQSACSVEKKRLSGQGIQSTRALFCVAKLLGSSGGYINATDGEL